MNLAAPPPRLDIVIVNWNAGNQLRDCLASIVTTNLEGIELGQVVVVDNASADDSLERIDLFPQLQLVRNSENRGFAAACNQGARHGEGDYLLLLNPDTILYPDSLTTPLQFMERPENAAVGIVGIQLIDENGRVARSCARFPTAGHFLAKMFGLDRFFPATFPGHFMTEWDHADSRDVDQVMGSFFLVRRPLFEALEGLDERFFVYFEEVDFSLRARTAGWRSYYLAAASAFHKGCGTTDQVKGARLFYSLRSRILFGFKHFDFFQAAVLLLATLLVEPVSRLLLNMAHFSLQDCKETLKGFTLLLKALPALLSEHYRRRTP